MSNIIQFEAKPRCAVCRSKDTVAVSLLVIDGTETTKYFCRQHQDRASAPLDPAI
jgi:hypothetical protein